MKEVSDTQEDYFNMDLSSFRKLDVKKCSEAYSQLRKVTKVIFSGSINPMINQLDYNKVKDKLKKQKFINEKEMNVIESVLRNRKLLEQRKMTMGVWESFY